MHQCTYLTIGFGALLLILTTSSTSASTIPIIVCPPFPMADTPLKVRQLCSALLEDVEIQPKEGGDYIEASPMYEGHKDTRGVKRQDVDHVFLRFGRRNGL